MRLTVGRCTLKPTDGVDYPGWRWNALGGNTFTIDPTAIDLLTQPEALRKARDEFNERTGGGIGGSKWVPPLLPVDFDPPVGFHWPEYVTTSRGEDMVRARDSVRRAVA